MRGLYTSDFFGENGFGSDVVLLFLAIRSSSEGHKILLNAFTELPLFSSVHNVGLFAFLVVLVEQGALSYIDVGGLQSRTGEAETFRISETDFDNSSDRVDVNLIASTKAVSSRLVTADVTFEVEVIPEALRKFLFSRMEEASKGSDDGRQFFWNEQVRRCVEFIGSKSRGHSGNVRISIQEMLGITEQTDKNVVLEGCEIRIPLVLWYLALNEKIVLKRFSVAKSGDTMVEIEVKPKLFKNHRINKTSQTRKKRKMPAESDDGISIKQEFLGIIYNGSGFELAGVRFRLSTNSSMLLAEFIKSDGYVTDDQISEMFSTERRVAKYVSELRKAMRDKGLDGFNITRSGLAYSFEKSE